MRASLLVQVSTWLRRSRRPAVFCAALAAAAALGSARAALAQDSTEAPSTHPSLLDRPHTVAILEAGIIALPTAPISPSNRGGSTPIGHIGSGDATVLAGLHLLYRATREWTFGAGALFAPSPTSESNYQGTSGLLARTHSRSYLFMGAEARYFPLRSRWIEGWFGLSGGVLIISDRFTDDNAPTAPPLVGTATTTVSTEGFSLGVGAGLDYLVTDNWVIGLALGAERWLLPNEKPFSQETSCDPIGDCPTLTGSVAAFEGGLTVGYRIPL
jgi:opacity protein-like surface antigen